MPGNQAEAETGETEMNTPEQTIKAMFPQAGITVGYIGNCGPGFDDRSWRVWTNIPNGRDSWGNKVNFQVYIAGPEFNVAAVAVKITDAMERNAEVV